MMNMDVAFSNMAAIKFEDILNQIRSSSLNFRMNVTPFTAVIHLKKTITKDKSGNFLHQNTFVNRTNNVKEADELMAKNLALEKEITDLKRSCLKASESITEIERNLELLNRQHGNVNDENYSEDEEENENRNEIESDGEEDEDKEINATTKKDSVVNYALTSTPLIKKSSISMCDSGVDLNSCVLTPVKEDIFKKTISCSQCKVVFENEGDLDIHRKGEHDPSLEFSCNICSRTFATEEDWQEHEDWDGCCKECGICFETSDNYGLHVLNLHQDKLQNEHDESTNYVMHLRFLAKFMTERFANGERCPCALCTK